MDHLTIFHQAEISTQWHPKQEILLQAEQQQVRDSMVPVADETKNTGKPSHRFHESQRQLFMDEKARNSISGICRQRT